MNVRMICILTCALLATSGASQAATLQLYTSAGTGQDGFTYGGAPDGVFSGAFNQGAVSKTPGGSFDAIEFLQFDFSGLGLTPANVSSITSVKLSVMQVTSTTLHPSNLNPDATHPLEIAVAPVTSTWRRGTLSANTQPTAGSSVATFSVSGLGQRFEVDVTNLVKSWIDGSVTNLGMRLAGTTIMGTGETTNDSPFYAAGIRSSFNPGGTFSTDGPLLTITTVPEPSTVLLAALAVPALAWLGWSRRRKPSAA